MKIVFLDIDGVIIHDNYKNPNQENIDESKIMLLKKLIDETSSEIVLISNWRVYNQNNEDNYPYSLLETLFQKQGLKIYDDAPLFEPKVIKQEIDPKTGYYSHIEYDPYTTRSGEIYSYINSHDDIDNYLIIDDEEYYNKYFGFENNFVKTNKGKGLTEENVKDAIEILNNIKRKTK